MINISVVNNGVIINDTDLVGLFRNMGNKYFFYPIQNEYNLRCAVFRKTLDEMLEEIAKRAENRDIEDKLIMSSINEEIA